FNGKMIVITSYIPLQYWYKSQKSNVPSWYRNVRITDNEDFKQLTRRISCYVVVTEDTVTVYNELDDDGKPCGKKTVYENELKKLKQEKQKENKFDFKAVFDSFCEKVEVERPTLFMSEVLEEDGLRF
ncbi:MAG: hypothetical protein J6R29_01320, partial [Clostridia bacterium]|nr:hypothetical protein [Clostridia bacterium]